MKPIHILLLFALLFPAASPLAAQEEEAVLDCNAPLPQENVVLHTGRSLYLVGETIWFKAYCLLNGQPSNELSKVLYVELFNAENKVLIQQKFRIEKEGATGSLEIPEEVQSGYHYLRAYTQYQRNFAPEHFAHRRLAILNPGSAPPALTLPKQDGLSFLLADGALVDGLPTRLLASFDPALCEKKEGITLEDQQGETLATCNALYHGHALFEFIPAAGMDYRVVIRNKNGQAISKRLPPVQHSGLICRTERLGDNQKITLRQSPLGRSSKVSVRIYSEGPRLEDSRVVEMRGAEQSFNFPLDGLSPGICYIVIEDSSDGKKPQAYPFYYGGPSPLPLSLATGQKNFGFRERVDLKIEAPAGEQCQLSVSVRKKGLGEDTAALPSFIWDNPWLLPSYLPDVRNRDETQLEMALMLLAARLNEKGMVSPAGGAGLQWIPEMRGLSISGRMRNKKSGAPAAGEVSMAAVVGNQPQINIMETRADGSFTFTLYGLEGRQNLFAGWKGTGEEPPEILINSHFSIRFPEVIPAPLTFEAEQHQLFEELHLQAQLSAAYEPEMEENTFNPSPPLLPVANLDNPDFTVTVANFVTLPALEEVFREIVPYVLVRREKGKAHLDVYNQKTQQAYNDPLVLLDNIPVFDIGRLLELNPGNIEKIEVFNTNYLLGDYLFGGLVSLHTNTDNFAGYQWGGESVFFRFQAFSPEKAFQHLVYPTAGARSSPRPDFRPMLYWNPKVETGPEEASLEFYTSGLPGTYEIVVRGFTKNGRPCFGRSLIEVGEGR